MTSPLPSQRWLNQKIGKRSRDLKNLNRLNAWQVVVPPPRVNNIVHNKRVNDWIIHPPADKGIYRNAARAFDAGGSINKPGAAGKEKKKKKRAWIRQCVPPCLREFNHSFIVSRGWIDSTVGQIRDWVCLLALGNRV